MCDFLHDTSYYNCIHLKDTACFKSVSKGVICVCKLSQIFVHHYSGKGPEKCCGIDRISSRK